VNKLITGTWSGMAGTAERMTLTVEFRPDHTYSATQTLDEGRRETVHGTYTFVGDNQIACVLDGSTDVVETVVATINGDTLTLRDQQQVDLVLIRLDQARWT
jgi:hypothetical protein